MLLTLHKASKETHTKADEMESEFAADFAQDVQRNTHQRLMKWSLNLLLTLHKMSRNSSAHLVISLCKKVSSRGGSSRVFSIFSDVERGPPEGSSGVLSVALTLRGLPSEGGPPAFSQSSLMLRGVLQRGPPVFYLLFCH